MPPSIMGGELTGVGSGFTPSVIPNPLSPPGGASQEQVFRTPTTGATPAPLYARPGPAPGEFELFAQPPPRVSEFEAYVEKAVGRPLPRFGASLILKGNRGFAAPSTASVPPDYKLNPGDELLVNVFGPVEASLKLTIDSEGRIFIPKVGALTVAGMRYGDLASALTRRFDELYKQSKVSVIVSQLHGITVYVTGYAVSPGAYTVSSLSTLIDAVLMAGGPAASGSFRSIILKRDDKIVSRLDLYDLLLDGDRTHDAILQNGDVINIEPAGPEIAVTGSVNEPEIFEAKPGETLADIIKYAGGPNTLADNTRLVISRISQLDKGGPEQISFSDAKSMKASGGTIVGVLTDADLDRPREQQYVLASIEGEVAHPGRYYMPPGANIGDLIQKAGGLTHGAFLYGSIFERESIRRQQKLNFDRALDQLQLTAAASPIAESNKLSEIGSSGYQKAQGLQVSASALINQLKEQQPTGRLVLDVAYDAPRLPETLLLENNDQLQIPPLPPNVGVFGAVFGPGEFIYSSPRSLASYLDQAGGPQRFADKGAIFIVRADGSVVSVSKLHGLKNAAARPGDVIVVPVRASSSTFERIKEIAQVVFNFGLGAAALAIAGKQL
jgi:protein involved in polysaccharide export with SLBB domain